MYRYIAIILVGLAVGFLTGWKTQGWRLGKEIATIQEAKAQAENKARQDALAKEQEYRQKEQTFQAALAGAQEKRNEEIKRINAQHAVVVASLRNRPERTRSNDNPEVPGTTASCTGTTGAELARGDAEFLAGYAADAAKLEAALTQCEAAYNALRK